VRVAALTMPFQPGSWFCTRISHWSWFSIASLVSVTHTLPHIVNRTSKATILAFHGNHQSNHWAQCAVNAPSWFQHPHTRGPRTDLHFFCSRRPRNMREKKISLLSPVAPPHNQAEPTSIVLSLPGSLPLGGRHEKCQRVTLSY
jgi:hypothetical protein